MKNNEFFDFCDSIKNKKTLSLKLFKKTIPSSLIVIEELPKELDFTLQTIINICKSGKVITSIGGNLQDTNGLNKEKVQQLFDYIFKNCSVFTSVLSLSYQEITSIEELIYFFIYFDIKVMNSCYKFYGRLESDKDMSMATFSKLVSDDLKDEFCVNFRNGKKDAKFPRIITNYLNIVHQGKEGILNEISNGVFNKYVVEVKNTIIEEANDIICVYLGKHHKDGETELMVLNNNYNRQLKNTNKKKLQDKVISKINTKYNRSKNYGRSNKKGNYVFYIDEETLNYTENGIYKYFKGYDFSLVNSFLEKKCPKVVNLYELDYLINLDLYKYHFSNKRSEFSWVERVVKFINTYELKEIEELVVFRYNILLQVFELEYIDYTLFEYLAYKENCSDINTLVCLYTNDYLPEGYKKSRFFFNALRIKEQVNLIKKRFMFSYYSPFTTLEKVIVKYLLSLDTINTFSDICKFFPYQCAFVISGFLGDISKNSEICKISEKASRICSEASVIFTHEFETANKNSPYDIKNILENDYIRNLRENNKNIASIISTVKGNSSDKVKSLAKEENNIYFTFEEDMCISKNFANDDMFISKTTQLFSDMLSEKTKEEIVERAKILDVKRRKSNEENEFWLNTLVEADSLSLGIEEARKKTYRTEDSGKMLFKDMRFTEALFDRLKGYKKKNEELEILLNKLSVAKGIDLVNLTPELFYLLNNRVMSELREEFEQGSYSVEYLKSQSNIDIHFSENISLQEEIKRLCEENSRLKNQIDGLEKVNISKQNEDILRELSLEEDTKKKYEEYRINTINKHVFAIKKLGLDKDLENKVIVALLSE